MFVWTSYDADAIETSNQKGERRVGAEYRTGKRWETSTCDTQVYMLACAAAASAARCHCPSSAPLFGHSSANNAGIWLLLVRNKEGWLKISFES